jgi:hypothetical protein
MTLGRWLQNTVTKAVNAANAYGGPSQPVSQPPSDWPVKPNRTASPFTVSSPPVTVSATTTGLAITPPGPAGQGGYSQAVVTKASPPGGAVTAILVDWYTAGGADPPGVFPVSLTALALSATTQPAFSTGTGADGAATISANTTLTRNMNYTSLTVNAGVTLENGRLHHLLHGNGQRARDNRQQRHGGNDGRSGWGCGSRRSERHFVRRRCR